jgi:hypothetical protein
VTGGPLRSNVSSAQAIQPSALVVERSHLGYLLSAHPLCLLGNHQTWPCVAG